MQAEIGMVFRNAVLDEHIMANLSTDVVVIVIACLHTADGDTVAILEKNVIGVIAVEVVVVRLVIVEGEILDDNVGYEFVAEDGEERRDCRVAKLPKVFTQRSVELETIAMVGD